MESSFPTDSLKQSKIERRHYTPAGWVTERQDSFTDFMCDCRDEGKTRCITCVKQVCESLSCKPAELVTCVVAALTWALPNDYVATITGVPMDQWFAVTGEMSRKDEEPIQFFIQCDQVEYGFARLWQMAEEVATERGEQNDVQ